MSRIITPSGKPVLSLHTQSEDGDLKLKQIFLNEFSADDSDRKNRIGLHPIYKFEEGGTLGSMPLSSENATIGIDMEIHKDKCNALYDNANDVDACLYGNITGNTEGVTWTCSGCNATNFDNALSIVSIPPGKVVCETFPNKWEIRNSDQCGDGETTKKPNDIKSNVFRYVPQGGDQHLRNCTQVADTDDTYDCDYPLPGGYVVRVQLTTDVSDGASALNQPLSLYTSRVTPRVTDTFEQINQPLSLDTSRVTDVFENASPLNQPLSLDASRVTDMFDYALPFNQPLSLDTFRVTDVWGMFGNA